MVLGASGLIGHQIYLHLDSRSDFEVLGFGFTNTFAGRLESLNAHHVDDLKARIHQLRPQYIVNAIGELISGSIKRPVNACYLNGLLPHLLDEIAVEVGSKLIHISTDCVFSGDSSSGYSEIHTPDGKGVYSKSKALGELISSRQCILRTSVVGPELGTRPEELFNWFMLQRGKIQGYRKAIWSGVTTIELAKAVVVAIVEDLVGLHHVTNGKPISKYELLELFKKHSGRPVEIEQVDGKKTNKTLIVTQPGLEVAIPDYDTMVREMFQFIRDHSHDIYGHYELGLS